MAYTPAALICGYQPDHMKCPSCTDYFDEARQSPVCPHLSIYEPKAPDGGLRIPQDARLAVDEAFKAQNQMSLYRFMGHGNPAVRLYAAQMCAALDEINAVTGH